jgi:SET domain-containing protein
MLLIHATAGPSPIHGTGLFARERIPAGTLVWLLDRSVDRAVTKDDLDSWPADEQERLRNYIYIDVVTGLYVLCGDDARYMNHADEPNTRTIGDQTFATRDISPGEELTCDYREFDAVSRKRSNSH